MTRVILAPCAGENRPWYRKGSDSATKRANRFKCRGSLEMAALLGGGEIRDERFRPKRGKNPGIWEHHGSRLMPGGGLEFWRPYSWKGRGADHGDRANGMKSWYMSAAITDRKSPRLK